MEGPISFWGYKEQESNLILLAHDDDDDDDDEQTAMCHLQHKLIGSYNRDEKCLQRGTDCVFK
jgi:hypothetical protein